MHGKYVYVYNMYLCVCMCCKNYLGYLNIYINVLLNINYPCATFYFFKIKMALISFIFMLCVFYIKKMKIY